MRPVGRQINEVVLDNDSAGVTFSPAASWSNSTSTRYYDEDYGASADAIPYKFASTTASGETATATYMPNIPAAGFYPVYTWVLRGTDRTSQLYRINHAGGTTEIRVDHSKVGSGWVYLGTYFFNSGVSATNGTVVISNNGTAGKVVIADAIRFGNGMGDFIDTPTGATTVSGYPREDENSFHWIARSVGVGTSLATATGASSNNNVSAPSNYAQFMFAGSFGEALYVGIHSNAGGGRGAVGLIDVVDENGDQRTQHQTDQATYLGRQINQDMQALNGTFEYDWSTRSTHTFTGEFGEINLGSAAEMDATIIEVAFHDSVEDAAIMRDPLGRDQTARSIYQGTIEYFQNWGGLSNTTSVPTAPISPRVASGASGALTVNWLAGPSTPAAVYGAAPTGYRVYTSTNGYSFDLATTVSGVGTTSATLNGLDPATPIYVRITAINAGGESLPSEVLTVLPSGGAKNVLIVNGYDRIARTLNFRYPYLGQLVDRVWPRFNNSRDYVVQVETAIQAAKPATHVDSASNDAVISGAVNLASYDSVIWISGNESTADDTFNATEQTKVEQFIAGGGNFFVSGSEIGWDLDQNNNGRSFYENTLKGNYVSDDAGTYTATVDAGGIFAGLSSLAFSNGSAFSQLTSQVYNVAFPDVIAPQPGAVAALQYNNGTGAAGIQVAGTGGRGNLVMFGFPFEAMTNVTRRQQVMGRILDFFASASATPGAPDLVAATDAGNLSTDNLTNRNNSSAAKNLQFSVSGTVAGATVTIYAGGTAIGSAVASGTTTTVTTNGTTTLTDGSRSITARQTESGKSESADSTALSITIDTAGPTADVVDISPDPRTVGVSSAVISFSEAVTGLDLADLSLNRDGGANLLAGSNAPNGIGSNSYVVPNLLAPTSVSGAYALALIAAGSGIADLAGNALAGDASDAWTHSLPAWLNAAGSAASWNSQTKALTITGAATITADPASDQPIVTVNGASGVLTIDPTSATVVNFGSLAINTGGRVTLAAHGSGAIRALVVTGNPTIDGTSNLDLTDNAMVVKNGSLAGIGSALAAGFANGWTGLGGINSSTAAADLTHSTSLGYASNASLNKTSFAGVSGLTSSDVLLKFTYAGDANLDGQVDIGDLGLLSGNWQQSGNDWFGGDFTYDGVVNIGDLGLLSGNWQKGVGNPL
jgi:hypothetical protein